jgi:hypothetical protein
MFFLEKEKEKRMAELYYIFGLFFGNCSAPYLCPFKPARVAQVRFTVLNEQI